MITLRKFLSVALIAAAAFAPVAQAASANVGIMHVNSEYEEPFEPDISLDADGDDFEASYEDEEREAEEPATETESVKEDAAEPGGEPKTPTENEAVKESDEEKNEADQKQTVSKPKEDSLMVQKAKQKKEMEKAGQVDENLTKKEYGESSVAEPAASLPITDQTGYSITSINQAAQHGSKYSGSKLVFVMGEEKVSMDVEDLFLCPDEARFNDFAFFVSDAAPAKDGISFVMMSEYGSQTVVVPNDGDIAVPWGESELLVAIEPLKPSLSNSTARKEGSAEQPTKDRSEDVSADGEEVELGDDGEEDAFGGEVFDESMEEDEDGMVLYVP